MFADEWRSLLNGSNTWSRRLFSWSALLVDSRRFDLLVKLLVWPIGNPLFWFVDERRADEFKRCNWFNWFSWFSWLSWLNWFSELSSVSGCKPFNWFNVFKPSSLLWNCRSLRQFFNCFDLKLPISDWLVCEAGFLVGFSSLLLNCSVLNEEAVGWLPSFRSLLRFELVFRGPRSSCTAVEQKNGQVSQ